jgi:hypothetical protein
MKTLRSALAAAMAAAFTPTAAGPAPTIKPTAASAACGEHERNVLDIHAPPRDGDPQGDAP